ncbi:Ribonuclease R winged-helix domain protein [Bibersteinia trehalosi USDA-ARS-USMARC-189]|uniref:Ribonuclease R winged-helix domain protein n=1 Tax=Bibersteinia trehalosi USDA-ARS-USMARC-189 TaxID=1263831 RepID=A0ABM5PC33_BIBTR|nr:winged-helix domain-containing protein [Bibersteinia trehalosi]AGH39006.1 Ribonuclease R winged-helix domain protein [Bibersteinia trehalosi USDA-ARS-USMARC-192]AHG83460.1 Ribonuclease R winged-helix domain protein [Bibersteinia trehalosi USDA-ARS-USMARC-189]
MALKELLTQDQRLVILRSLAEAGYDANESILNDCLDLYGHDISRDLVRTHLCWLEEQGLLTLERLKGGYMVASITQRGLDVAQGRTKVDGVKPPRPKI